MKKVFILFRLVLFFVLLLNSTLYAAETRLLTNREYFQALDEKIKGAKSEILVSVYLFRTTESKKNLATKIRSSLIDAVSRGIKVSVYLEREGSGRRGSTLNEDNAYTGKVLSGKGVKVFFDTTETTTHNKLIVIDRRYVFIGSHNLSDSALRRNNEASVLIESTGLAEEAESFIRGIR